MKKSMHAKEWQILAILLLDTLSVAYLLLGNMQANLGLL